MWSCTQARHGYCKVGIVYSCRPFFLVWRAVPRQLWFERPLERSISESIREPDHSRQTQALGHDRSASARINFCNQETSNDHPWSLSRTDRWAISKFDTAVNFGRCRWWSYWLRGWAVPSTNCFEDNVNNARASRSENNQNFELRSTNTAVCVQPLC